MADRGSYVSGKRRAITGSPGLVMQKAGKLSYSWGGARKKEADLQKGTGHPRYRGGRRNSYAGVGLPELLDPV